MQSISLICVLAFCFAALKSSKVQPNSNSLHRCRQLTLSSHCHHFSHHQSSQQFSFHSQCLQTTTTTIVVNYYCCFNGPSPLIDQLRATFNWIINLFSDCEIESERESALHCAVVVVSAVALCREGALTDDTSVSAEMFRLRWRRALGAASILQLPTSAAAAAVATAKQFHFTSTTAAAIFNLPWPMAAVVSAWLSSDHHHHHHHHHHHSHCQQENSQREWAQLSLDALSLTCPPTSR